MTKFRLYDWGFNLFFIALFIVALWLAVSCKSDVSSIPETKLSTTETISYTEFVYPVRTQYLTKDKKTYMIVSTLSVDGGVAVRNLTLDSLQIRYYQMMLGLPKE